MSIMDRDSPVSLSNNVVIVTNASSAVGVVVCKTLLKANALVLGTNTHDKDDTLDASAYSHFQFHQCAPTDGGAVHALLADARAKFNTQRVDVLVNLTRDETSAELKAAHEKLADDCKDVMEARDGGSIVTCRMEAAGLEMTDMNAISVPDMGTGKVRCNSIASGPNKLEPYHEYAEARDHFDFLFKPASHRIPKEATAEMRAMFDFSNVVLFLASGLSRNLDGLVLDRHGHLVQA